MSTKPQLLFFAIQPIEPPGYKINLELSDSLTNNLNNHLGERFGCREKWLLRKYCRMTANSDDEVKRKLSDRNTDLAIGMGKKGILRIGIPSDQGDTTFMQICPSLDKQKNWYHCQLNSSLETTMMILAIIQFTRKIEEAMQIQYMII